MLRRPEIDINVVELRQNVWEERIGKKLRSLDVDPTKPWTGRSINDDGDEDDGQGDGPPSGPEFADGDDGGWFMSPMQKKPKSAAGASSSSRVYVVGGSSSAAPNFLLPAAVSGAAASSSSAAAAKSSGGAASSGGVAAAKPKPSGPAPPEDDGQAVRRTRAWLSLNCHKNWHTSVERVKKGLPGAIEDNGIVTKRIGEFAREMSQAPGDLLVLNANDTSSKMLDNARPNPRYEAPAACLVEVIPFRDGEIYKYFTAPNESRIDTFSEQFLLLFLYHIGMLWRKSPSTDIIFHMFPTRKHTNTSSSGRRIVEKCTAKTVYNWCPIPT